jgi:hypothetical protein
MVVLVVSAATTASPISRVPTFRVPSDQMSGVRNPLAAAFGLWAIFLVITEIFFA